MYLSYSHIAFYLFLLICFPVKSQEIITDKSFIYKQDGSIEIFKPKDIDELKKLIYSSKINKSKIIISGKNHSANGSSISNANEVSLSVIQFNKILIKEDRVIVGAGVIVEELDKILRKNGYCLITKNEGGNGPTVGGFISAGGIGNSNNVGFWETVFKIKFIDGKGKINELTPQNKNFKWLFGSMGQLGVIYEAEIKIKKLTENDSIEPKNDTTSLFKNNYFFWFPFFVDTQKKDSLKLLVEKLIFQLNSNPKLSNIQYFLNQEGIDITFKNFNPPLLFNNDRNFTVIGIKLFIEKSDTTYVAKLTFLRSLIDDFLIENQIKSYFQVSFYEQNKINVQKYLGIKEYIYLSKIKKYYDPNNIFGKSIF